MAIRFNHLNIIASPDSGVQQMLVNVLGLEIGSRPNFPFNGQWLYQGDKALVHIIENEIGECQFGHLAFELDMSLQDLTNKLQQQEIKYNVRQVPDSNNVQVFVRAGEMVFELIASDKPTQQKFTHFTQHEELL